jgi:hypothetical protein
MQTENKRMLLSTSILKVGIILRKLRTATAPRLKFYTSIDFLPIRNFYMVVETGDHRWLLKGVDYEHLPEYEVPPEIWENIWYQFVEISNDRDYQIYFETLRKYLKVQNRYETLKAELFTLYFRFNQSYADDLAEEGIAIDMTDREKYLESINVGVNRIENLNTKIQLLAKELEARTKAHVKSNFMETVYSVEAFQGFPINIDRVSIKMFITMLNKIKQENGKRKN